MQCVSVQQPCLCLDCILPTIPRSDPSALDLDNSDAVSANRHFPRPPGMGVVSGAEYHKLQHMHAGNTYLPHVTTLY